MIGTTRACTSSRRANTAASYSASSWVLGCLRPAFELPVGDQGLEIGVDGAEVVVGGRHRRRVDALRSSASNASSRARPPGLIRNVAPSTSRPDRSVARRLADVVCSSPNVAARSAGTTRPLSRTACSTANSVIVSRPTLAQSQRGQHADQRGGGNHIGVPAVQGGAHRGVGMLSSLGWSPAACARSGLTRRAMSASSRSSGVSLSDHADRVRLPSRTSPS